MEIKRRRPLTASVLRNRRLETLKTLKREEMSKPDYHRVQSLRKPKECPTFDDYIRSAWLTLRNNKNTDRTDPIFMDVGLFKEKVISLDGKRKWESWVQMQMKPLHRPSFARKTLKKLFSEKNIIIRTRKEILAHNAKLRKGKTAIAAVKVDLFRYGSYVRTFDSKAKTCQFFNFKVSPYLLNQAIKHKKLLSNGYSVKHTKVTKK